MTSTAAVAEITTPTVADGVSVGVAVLEDHPETFTSELPIGAGQTNGVDNRSAMRRSLGASNKPSPAHEPGSQL